ncbi:hypothetical protein [Fretibacter rubidus]
MRELTTTEIETVVGGSGPVIIETSSGPVIIETSGPVIIET